MTTSELTYEEYARQDLVSYQKQLMTPAQFDKLQNLCERYRVEFDPTHYVVRAKDAVMMKGYAEGWVGGNGNANRTIYVGVEPNGNSHS